MSIQATDQKRPLTAAQTTVMTAICELLLARRYPPSIREISQRAGCKPNVIGDHLRRIEEKGWIKREPRRARALIVIGGPAAVLAEIGPETDRIKPE